MKKVLSLVLAVLLLLPTVLVAHADEAEFVCQWATERELTDSLGSGVIYFRAYPQAERYMVDVYKDGAYLETLDAYASLTEEEELCELTEVLHRNGSGAYTCTVSAVDFEWGYEPGVGTLYATTPMSNPYVYTEPTLTLPPVTNVRFENNAVYFDHDALGVEATYQMDFYIEYGDASEYSFFGNSDYEPTVTQERYGYAMESYERTMEWILEEEPTLAAQGTPRIRIEIYAKAWDMNAAKPSLKVYFYPNGEKATYTEELPMPAWTIASNAQLSFAGSVSALEAYNIKDNNYFKLRDVALKLTEMGYPVDVTWDANRNAINLITGQPYTQVGGELKQADGLTREAIPCDAAIYLNGMKIDLAAYTIGGNNFFKLRDLCGALGISVDWDEAASLIIINAPTYFTESDTENLTTLEGNFVYRTPSGKRYHFDLDCGGENSYQITLQDAKNAGLTACQKCAY